MDVVLVEAAAQDAARSIRNNNGPYFLELRTYRFRAHSMYDPELYRSKQEIEEWKVRDPLVTFTSWLKSKGFATDEAIAAIEDKVASEIAAAVAFAEAGTWEPVEDLTRDVYTKEQRA
jgi:TPP-dependent pyruvate/acetoin dehydrogenase alpha subunit